MQVMHAAAAQSCMILGRPQGSKTRPALQLS